MRIKNSRRKGLPASKPIITGSLVFIVAFFAAFFASSVLAPIQSSDAANLATANVAFTGYYVKLNSPDVSMDLLTAPASTMTVVQNTVKTVTNSPNGYKLYLSMSEYDVAGAEKSTADKAKNGLYLEGDLSRTDNMVFNAASGKGGTGVTAALAALTDNTWGYAVDKDSIGAPDIWLNENHSTMSSATPTSDKFAGVPVAGAVDLIQETSSSEVAYDTPEGEVEDTDYTDAMIYYGIRGNAGLEAGSYTNTIAYTAIGKTEPSGSITFNPAAYTFDAPYSEMVWDDTVTIQTPLYTSAAELGNATVTLNGGPDNVSNVACSNATLFVLNNLLNVTCTLPQAKAGTYDVVVYLEKYGQIYTGSYTYVDPYSQSYTITISNTNTTTNVQSIDIPYGGTGYVEVTPTAGYLSSVICPQGYTCSGYNTGSFATGTQIIAVANNNTTADGTLALVGANRTLSQITYMQEMGPGICNASSKGESATLTDSRDNNTYAVRKLADGKCWMVQNLRLTGSRTLTSADSNVSSDWTLPAENTSFPTSCVNTAYNMSAGSTTYGNFYNWYAATAGTGTCAMTSGNATSSICPKGWRLPTSGGTSSDFALLDIAWGGTGASRASANTWSNFTGTSADANHAGFPLAGYRLGSSTGGQGTLGNYWSSTAGNSSNAYNLNLNGSSSGVDPSSNNNKYYGFSVRCVAQ